MRALLGDYRNARFPRASEDAVVPLCSTPQEIDDFLAKYGEWLRSLPKDR